MLREQNYDQIKRWEKAEQLKTLYSETFSGPLANCAYRDISGIILTVPVFIVQLYQKDLCCVKPCLELSPLLNVPPYWIMRQGIDWTIYLPMVLQAYKVGKPVPRDFFPRQKISEALLAQCEKLPPKHLPETFVKMRESGLLPALEILDKGNYPKQMSWANRKLYYQDFSEKAKL